MLICIIHTYMYVYIYIWGGLKLLGEVGTWKSAGFIVPSAALDIIFICEYSIYLHTHTHTYTHTHTHIHTHISKETESQTNIRTSARIAIFVSGL